MPKDLDPVDFKDEINKVSPSFCIAKWMQVTIDLQHGTNHSCHHPKRHKIPVEELENNPSALHNTQFKKELRKQMQDGVRPAECDYCWRIEDADPKNISDRIMKSSASWANPHLKKTAKLDWRENINPSYVEIMFSSECNFACSYCDADVSSGVRNEMKKFGKYPVSDSHIKVGQYDKLPFDEDTPTITFL